MAGGCRITREPLPLCFTNRAFAGADARARRCANLTRRLAEVGATVAHDEATDRLLTNGEYTASVVLSRCTQSAARTHEERERLIKSHLKPRLGGVKLAELNALHIEGLHADMRRTRWARSRFDLPRMFSPSRWTTR